MIRRFLISILMRLLFRGEFVEPMDKVARAEVFKKMGGDPRIVRLFQSLYTRMYQAFVFDPLKGRDPYVDGIVIGRILELEYILVWLEDADKEKERIEKERTKEKKMTETFKKTMDRFKSRSDKITNIIKKPL